MPKVCTQKQRKCASRSGVSRLLKTDLANIARKMKAEHERKVRDAWRKIQKDKQRDANVSRTIRRIKRHDPDEYKCVQNVQTKTFYYEHLHWTVDSDGTVRFVPSSNIVYPDLRVKPYHKIVGYVPEAAEIFVGSGYGARRKGEKYPNITNANTYYSVAERGWMWVRSDDFDGAHAKKTNGSTE